MLIKHKIASNKLLQRSLIAFLLLCFTISSIGYCCAKQLLFYENRTDKADAIIILGGDSVDRPWRAMELFKSGVASVILISGTGDDQFISKRLELTGIPKLSIITESLSRTTKENAEYSTRWMKENGVKRAIIVTSWYHSRRAMACFKHYGGETELFSCPSYNGPSMEGKPTIDESRLVFSEYLKMAYYIVRYGIWPTEAG
jgi:uncharacterized SAM-binding protein YcdF (DUF218 family)